MTQEAFKLFANEIKAFQEGKQIQIFIRNKWVDTDNPSFDVKSKYRVKPEEPKPTKRLPTIEEVEKWFLENRVFRLKSGTGIVRMNGVVLKNNQIGIGDSIISIDKFCKDFTHYDGSELYITENEKNIYRSVDNAKGDDSICSIIYAIKEKIPYGGEIADFPIEVVERMLECQVEQGNKRDVSVFEQKKRINKYFKGFTWAQTKEGLCFWEEVIVKNNFDLFFKTYPKKSNQ